MNRAQLLLIAILCVASARNFARAEKVEQGHRDSHHEKDFLKQRTKRYAMGRVPLSYLSAASPLQNRIDDDGIGYSIEKRLRSNALHANPVASHFRELQPRQIRRQMSYGDDRISPAQLQAYKNSIKYYGAGGESTDEEGAMDNLQSSQPEVAPLTDEELQTLLLLLDGYKLQEGKTNTATQRNFYNPPAQYFTQEMMDRDPSLLGKRETGKRSRGQLGLEQPMSFENSLGDNYPVFLNVKRSKRIGDSSLKPLKTMSSVRIKKETDPAVEASLDKIFGERAQQPVESQQHSTLIPTTAISSSDQIPAPSSSQTKPKSSINWSEYFGIDKRQGKKRVAPKLPSLSSSETINHHDAEHEHEANNKHDSEKNDHDKTITSTKSNLGSTVAASDNNKGSDKLKEKKEKSRQENDTEDKADRKWILKEFYKNLAMSTKRKRESPQKETTDNLEKIERKMEEAGDQIIWDTLKYTGAHRDAELSPEELANVKKEIIQKLAAAYSLEKIREAIEEFRQQVAQLKDKQQYY